MHYFETYPEAINTGLKSVLKKEPNIHSTCIIKDSHLGDYTELMMHTYIVESNLDDYSYCAGNVQIIYSTVGKFCSIANSVRINPGNHPQWRVTQHHMTYRRVAFGFDETDDTEFFNWRRAHKCTIGHDVWIGHGAIIMPGVTIGHGAIIGSGPTWLGCTNIRKFQSSQPDARADCRRYRGDACPEDRDNRAHCGTSVTAEPWKRNVRDVEHS